MTDRRSGMRSARAEAGQPLAARSNCPISGKKRLIAWICARALKDLDRPPQRGAFTIRRSRRWVTRYDVP